MKDKAKYQKVQKKRFQLVAVFLSKMYLRISFIFVCLSNCKYLAIQTLQFWSRSKRRKGRINRLRKGPLFRAQHYAYVPFTYFRSVNIHRKCLNHAFFLQDIPTQRFVSSTVIMVVLPSHSQLIVDFQPILTQKSPF